MVLPEEASPPGDENNLRRRSTLPETDKDGRSDAGLLQGLSGWTRLGEGMVNRTLVAALVGVLVLVGFVSIVSRGNPSYWSSPLAEDAKLTTSDNISSHSAAGPPPPPIIDELLGGLLAPGFDRNSCLSRYQESSYRRPSPYKPSSYLISRLRDYEKLHKRCGPGSEFYRKSMEELKNNQTSESAECKYVVWLSDFGLGNRIMTLVSSFLYALLTNRVLLIHYGPDFVDLLCEPFPEETWILSGDFPLNDKLGRFRQFSPDCYGNLLKHSRMGPSEKEVPPYLYVHIYHDYDDDDKLFFCDEEGQQGPIGKVPWLFFGSNLYFVPSLFLMPSYEEELSNLFPEKHTVFHHLARYLLHPSDTVWGMITRYYDSYLARADERIGIQIRTFSGDNTLPHVVDQVLACAENATLLPELEKQLGVVPAPKDRKLKSVLVTSLNPEYYENLKTMYWTYPTLSGDIIAVYQPSREMHQQIGNQVHHQKALSEMYLLSFSDKLVTSTFSTFGYVAQGLAGKRAWILKRPEGWHAPNTACVRSLSMEPCHLTPPARGCKSKNGTEAGSLVPYVKHCEDVSWGLKLIDVNAT